MRLYEMTEATAQLYDMLQDEEIDEKTFNDTVEAMGATDKVEGYCQIIKEFDGDSEKIDTEIKRLSAKKKTLANRKEWLKKQLLEFYKANGNKKIKAGTFTVSARKSDFVSIYGEELIPSEYLILRTSLNKMLIKDAIKRGEIVPGAEMKQRESVQIK